MAVVNSQLPIDPSGIWSPVQAQRVLDVINPVAAERGLVYHSISVPSFKGSPRVMLVAYCKEHDVAIEINSVCSECLRLK